MFNVVLISTSIITAGRNKSECIALIHIDNVEIRCKLHTYNDPHVASRMEITTVYPNSLGTKTNYLHSQMEFGINSIEAILVFLVAC
jgi:hypothetical protein